MVAYPYLSYRESYDLEDLLSTLVKQFHRQWRRVTRYRERLLQRRDVGRTPWSSCVDPAHQQGSQFYYLTGFIIDWHSDSCRRTSSSKRRPKHEKTRRRLPSYRDASGSSGEAIEQYLVRKGAKFAAEIYEWGGRGRFWQSRVFWDGCL